MNDHVYVPSIGGLPVIVAGGCEGIDDLAVRNGERGVGYVGRDDVDCTGFHEILFAADDHFELPFHYISYLFVNVMMKGGGVAFFDIPDDERALIAMDHFSGKARNRLFYRDIVEILHGVHFAEGKQYVDMPTRLPARQSR